MTRRGAYVCGAGHQGPVLLSGKEGHAGTQAHMELSDTCMLVNVIPEIHTERENSGLDGF